MELARSREAEYYMGQELPVPSVPGALQFNGYGPRTPRSARDWMSATLVVLDACDRGGQWRRPGTQQLNPLRERRRGEPPPPVRPLKSPFSGHARKNHAALTASPVGGLLVVMVPVMAARSAGALVR